ncbi:MAG: acetolactate synthase large subunit [Microthrixaceae bacterium]
MTDTTPNGAQSLIRTLVDSGVEVCFANPGTSEMHFVAALDDVPGMRAVLGLFEGVVTGAADGYARVAGKPACTLLHLGPGLGNGFANLHNARRGHTPMVNIVGDHATYHKRFDAPLESDIDAVAGAVSAWVHRSMTPDAVPGDGARAVAESLRSPGGVATLILPADVSWLPSGGAAAPQPVQPPAVVPAEAVEAAARALRSDGPSVLFIGGRCFDERGQRAAVRVAQASGAKLLGETFPRIQRRGAGLPVVERLAYLAEFAQMQLGEATSMVLVDVAAPASFFAYPGKASSLVPEGCAVSTLAGLTDDPIAALEALADALEAPQEVPVAEAARPERPTGALTAEAVAAALGALLPENAIVVDEANTSGLFAPGATQGAPAHDWLTLTGGAIGAGVPMALGAAIAAPDRPVVCLQADGSAMYTLQGWWSQVRENTNVTTVIYNNSSYAVLRMELDRVGAEAPGPKALNMLDLSGPDLDFTKLAEGMGVHAERADTAEGFTAALERALATDGPSLVEAIVPPLGI